MKGKTQIEDARSMEVSDFGKRRLLTYADSFRELAKSMEEGLVVPRESEEREELLHARRLQENEKGIEQLANYLQKESAGKKRWKSSQGLVRPWVTTSDDKYSRRMIDKMANMPPDCEAVKTFWERKFSDYVLYECQNYFNKETARWSIYLKMRLRR